MAEDQGDELTAGEDERESSLPVDELAAELPTAEEEGGGEHQLSPEARELMERRIDNLFSFLNEGVDAFLDRAAERAVELENIAEDVETSLQEIVKGTPLEGDVAFIVNQLRRIAERSRIEPEEPEDPSATEAKKLADAKDAVASDARIAGIKGMLLRAKTPEELQRAYVEVNDTLKDVRSRAEALDSDTADTETRISRRVYEVLEFGPASLQGTEGLQQVDRKMQNLRDDELYILRRTAQNSRDNLIKEINDAIGELNSIVTGIQVEKFTA